MSVAATPMRRRRPAFESLNQCRRDVEFRVGIEAPVVPDVPVDRLKLRWKVRHVEAREIADAPNDEVLAAFGKEGAGSGDARGVHIDPVREERESRPRLEAPQQPPVSASDIEGGTRQPNCCGQKVPMGAPREIRPGDTALPHEVVDVRRAGEVVEFACKAVMGHGEIIARHQTCRPPRLFARRVTESELPRRSSLAPASGWRWSAGRLHRKATAGTRNLRILKGDIRLVVVDVR